MGIWILQFFFLPLYISNPNNPVFYGILEKVKFENLKELNLINNQISDISILSKVKFDSLKNYI